MNILRIDSEKAGHFRLGSLTYLQGLEANECRGHPRKSTGRWSDEYSSNLLVGRLGGFIL